MAYKPFDTEIASDVSVTLTHSYFARADVTSSPVSRAGQPSPAVFSNILMRSLDIAISAIAVVLFGPVMIVIAILVWSTSGGPIFYRQKRVGLNGQIFYCLKFRTMHKDADRLLEALLAGCAQSREEWERDQKLRNDPRIIGLGRFLRRASLDELPQLFNVLRGDMSIVGPRPIIATEAPRYGRYIKQYCAVRPGITGLWQVSGRNGTTYRRRVACDVLYARKQSAITNCVIMVRTVPVVLGAQGAS